MKNIISICFVLLLFTKSYAQNVTVLPNGITPAAPNSYQRLPYDEIMMIPSPVEGDIVYDLTYKCMRVFADGKWVSTIIDPLNYFPNIIPVITAGGSSDDYGSGVALDDSSNIYITGTFTGIAFFGSVSKTSNHNTGNMYIAKYSKTGILKWVQTAKGTDPVTGSAVCVDSKGNVYVKGGHGRNTEFGAITITSNYQGGASFLAKYNSNGTIQWVKATEDLYYGSMTIDNDDILHVIGSYNGTQTLGATTMTSQGSYDVFVASYNTTSDTWLWVKSVGSTGYDTGSKIVLDSSGKVYAIGTFSGTVAFGSISKTASASANSFIGKYDPIAADWVWVEAIYPTIAYLVSADNSGNLYLTGSFTSTITLGAITKYGASGGNTDIFIAKINTNGITEWLETAGGTGGSNNDGGSSIVVDASANVYVTGYFAGTAKFGTKTLTTTSGKALFIAKYNSIGGIIWAQKIDRASGGSGSSSKIIVGADGYVYITGTYSGTLTFGKTPLTSKGSSDIFVAKVD